MPKIYTSADQLIGSTPLLRLERFENALSLNARILAKLEFFNPAGSSKDRVAKAMIDDAEERGILKKGSVIIEATSGNTGIGLASVGTSRGYSVMIVMPDTMSPERIKIMSSYGAEVVLTDGRLGMNGAIEKAKELSKRYPNSFIPSQFTNPANVNAHFKATGPEIWRDTDGSIDFFVAGIGTGGTVTGVGKYLKAQNKNIKIVGVEPAESAVISGEKAGAHTIQGIGAGFIPEILDLSVLDEMIKIKSDLAPVYAEKLARSEGLLVGISSGAALCAAVELAKRKENTGKTIVVLLPDTGERYLS